MPTPVINQHPFHLRSDITVTDLAKKVKAGKRIPRPTQVKTNPQTKGILQRTKETPIQRIDLLQTEDRPMVETHLTMTNHQEEEDLREEVENHQMTMIRLKTTRQKAIALNAEGKRNNLRNTPQTHLRTMIVKEGGEAVEVAEEAIGESKRGETGGITPTPRNPHHQRRKTKKNHRLTDTCDQTLASIC